MKILVTGAEGQLGKSIRLISGGKKGIEFCFASRSQLDIRDANGIGDFISGWKPDYCINCAAYTAVDDAEQNEDKAFMINAHGAATIAKACAAAKAHLIHLSTDYVYHNDRRTPLIETDPLNPQSVYAKSKLEGEKLVCSHLSESIIIRTSWVFSPFGNNFVKTMLRLAKLRNEIGVVHDQKGCPTYAPDLAEAIVQICQKISEDPSGNSYRGIYNYCNQGATNWHEFAGYIFQLSKLSCKANKISSEAFGAKAPRPEWSVLSTEKIRTNFNLDIPSWRQSLEKCLIYLNN